MTEIAYNALKPAKAGEPWWTLLSWLLAPIWFVWMTKDFGLQMFPKLKSRWRPGWTVASLVVAIAVTLLIARFNSDFHQAWTQMLAPRAPFAF